MQNTSNVENFVELWPGLPILIALFIITTVFAIYLYRNKERIDRYYEKKEIEHGRVWFFLLHGSLGWWRGNLWKFFTMIVVMFGFAILLMLWAVVSSRFSAIG